MMLHRHFEEEKNRNTTYSDDLRPEPDQPVEEEKPRRGRPRRSYDG